jgi:hypothetical protein
MRLTYFDDCGLFNAKQEPYIVVAGILVDADKQLIGVEERINQIASSVFPPTLPPKFHFHAKDLFHGSGFFPRAQWRVEDRMSILMEIAKIPGEFNLPVTYAFVRRDSIPRYSYPPGMTEREREVRAYINTVARFCESVEEFMTRRATDEVTVIIAEDKDSVRTRLKRAHNEYRDHNAMKQRNPLLVYFPFYHIREGLHFLQKTNPHCCN